MSLNLVVPRSDLYVRVDSWLEGALLHFLGFEPEWVELVHRAHLLYLLLTLLIVLEQPSARLGLIQFGLRLHRLFRLRFLERIREQLTDLIIPEVLFGHLFFANFNIKSQ